MLNYSELRQQYRKPVTHTSTDAFIIGLVVITGIISLGLMVRYGCELIVALGGR